jgi:putative oxidoreductase
LVQFALQGSSDSEQYAILLIRVSIGLFCAIPGVTNYLSPAARSLFTTRWLRPKPSLRGFLIDMTVATLTSGFRPKGLSCLNWLDDFLYLPEVLYVLFFIWLLCSGPGKVSVDYWLAGKLLG